MYHHVRLIALIALSFTLALIAEADVSYEKPDLSAFKLRRINAKELARQRAEQPITDLASGAVYMRQSLFVSDTQIRCASYAHLFSLIKSQTDKSPKVHQNGAESLAIMVAAERDFYGHLFASNANSAAALLIEAVQLLEKRTDQEARAAWLDLVGCLSAYLASQPDVEEFLQDTKRANAIDSLRNFNSIPVLTNGVVGYLTKRITGEPLKGHSVGGRFISNDLFNRARALVESMDDERTREARSAFAKNPHQPLQQLAQTPVQVDPKQVGAIEEQQQVELVVPAEEDEASTLAEGRFSMAQLEALEFVKVRLESASQSIEKAQQEPRLSIQLALDFQSHWEDLKNYKVHLDPTSALGRRAIPFVEDPSNEEVAKRVNKAVDTYAKLVGVLAEIKIREGKMKHVNELGQQVKRLAKLLDQMDPAFDVDNLHRLHSQWKAKYIEYSTVFDRLINRVRR